MQESRKSAPPAPANRTQ